MAWGAIFFRVSKNQVVNQRNSRMVFTLIQCLAVCRERWLLRVLCPQIEVDWPRCLVLSSMISEYWQSKRPIMSLFSRGLLICTLISENQGLEKLRSTLNLRKISGPAELNFCSVHLNFFSVCHLNFFQIYTINLKKSR